MERMFMQRHAAIEMLLWVPSQVWEQTPPSDEVRAQWLRLLLDVRAARVNTMVTFWESPSREIFIS